MAGNGSKNEDAGEEIIAPILVRFKLEKIPLERRDEARRLIQDLSNRFYMTYETEIRAMTAWFQTALKRLDQDLAVLVKGN